MILVTSANGNTGSEVVAALLAAHHEVKAFVRPGTALRSALQGAQIFSGDLFDKPTLKKAMQGVQSVFHISPPHHAGEFALGQAVVDAASDAGVERFVLLSAIHPLLNALPGHRMKRMVEEYLIDSGMPYTVLQPTMFMQNTDLRKVLSNGVLPVPYSVDMPMSFIDRADLAAVAVKVLGETGHLRATYSLVGTEPTTFATAAAILSGVSGKPVVAKQVPAEAVLSSFPRQTAEQRYTADTFERMFAYYNRHGLTGNSNVLRWLLGRPPAGFHEYFQRVLAQEA